MSLSGTGTNKAPTQNTTAMGDAMGNAKQTYQAPPSQPQNNQARQPRDLRSFKSNNQGLMPSTPAAQILVSLTEALRKVYAKTIKPSEATVELIAVDRNAVRGIALSALIVCVSFPQFPRLGVAYHTLVLEGSNDKFEPQVINEQGKSVERYFVAGDAANAQMDAVVQAEVARAFPQMVIRGADFAVIPRDYKVEDENLVYRTAANAVSAAESVLDAADPEFIDLNLRALSNDLGGLVVRTTFNNPVVSDDVGLPIRSDIVIEFAAENAQAPNQPQTPFQGPLTDKMAITRGFMELTYSNVEQANVNPYYTPTAVQQAQSFRRFNPRFVITELNSLIAPTLPAQLLALATAAGIRENNGWIAAFEPNRSAGKQDLRDIGAIGIDANFEMNPNGRGKRVDTKANNFGTAELGQLINLVIRPELILSMDVSECGTDTWMNGVYALAAKQDVKANNAILQAANTLTGGLFEQHFQASQFAPGAFPQGNWVARDENNAIHLGYYTDSNGIVQDLRNIDYLAMLNWHGETDYEIVRGWSDTFERTDYSLNRRLQARKDYLKGMLRDMVITGMATRVTFEPAFIIALTKAVAEAGLKARPIMPYLDLQSGGRASSQHAATAGIGAGTSGMFTQNAGNTSQGNFGARSMFGNRAY